MSNIQIALRLALEAFSVIAIADNLDWIRHQAEQQAAALREALAQTDNTSKLYEELRSIIDGGSESFTHEDAVQYLKDNLAPLKWTPEDTAYRPGGLPQPEQKPVLLLQSHRDGYWCVDLTCKKCYSADFRFKHKNSVDKESLTTPPQRQARSADTWVGLTDDEIAKLDLSAVTIKDATSDFRAIEAKLKEKNSD